VVTKIKEAFTYFKLVPEEFHSKIFTQISQLVKSATLRGAGHVGWMGEI